MFILVLRKERAFKCTFQLFPLILRPGNVVLVVVFPFVVLGFFCLFFWGGWVACFVYLHIYLFYTDKSNVFFVTPTSAACLVQGMVTVPGLWPCKHTRTWKALLLCACASFLGAFQQEHGSFPDATRHLKPVTERSSWQLVFHRNDLALPGAAAAQRGGAEPRVRGGRSFGPWEMLDYCPSSSCVGISRKVLFQSKSQARSLLSTLSCRSQPLWAWPENRRSPNIPKASFSLLYSPLSSWFLDPGLFFTKSLLKFEKSSPI